jgi:hypothetical protein
MLTNPFIFSSKCDYFIGKFSKSFLDHVGGHVFFFLGKWWIFVTKKFTASVVLQAPVVSNTNVTKLIPFSLTFVLKKQDCYNKIFLLKKESQTRETSQKKR